MRIFNIMAYVLLSFFMFTLGNMMQKCDVIYANDDEENRMIFPKKPFFKEPYTGFKQLTNEEYRDMQVARVQHLMNNEHGGTIQEPENIKWLRRKILTENQKGIDTAIKIYWALIFVKDWENIPPEQLEMPPLEQLEWVVETNKKSYCQGEPVFFRFSMKNISEDNVPLVYIPYTSPSFALRSIKIQRIWKHQVEEVYMTREGYGKNYPYFWWGKGLSWAGGVDYAPYPKDESIRMLNVFYDLSEPGEYELTFYTRNFLGGDENQIGEYPKPCTIRFTIEDKMYEPKIEWDDSNISRQRIENKIDEVRVLGKEAEPT